MNEYTPETLSAQARLIAKYDQTHEAIFIAHAAAWQEQVERLERPACVWVYDDSQDSWETTCDRSYCLSDGCPYENGMSYCPFCGGPLVEAAPERMFDPLA
uniref:Uncharacterized protein n=1 Tax=viral metagenome TaxID=1070528 RepID=A0A6M3IJV1_9ZZZZ